MIVSGDDVFINAFEFIMMLKGVQDCWTFNNKIQSPEDLKNISFCFTYENGSLKSIEKYEVEK